MEGWGKGGKGREARGDMVGEEGRVGGLLVAQAVALTTVNRHVRHVSVWA